MRAPNITRVQYRVMMGSHLGVLYRRKMTTLTVGGASISVDEATDLVGTYVANKTRTWAYPAYDAYPGHPGAELGRADLLAPALLNAGQNPIETYYGFETLLQPLNAGLARLDLTTTLAAAGDDTIDAIAQLYGVLDTTKPKHISLTKLSKVLHRKRPGLLPLYDRNIRACYVHIGRAPVPLDRNRSWTELSRVWVRALQEDLTDHLSEWTTLAELAPGPAISPLRALDIVGWHLGRPGYTPRRT